MKLSGFEVSHMENCYIQGSDKDSVLASHKGI